VLALEPEAASLYCKYLPVEKRGGAGYEAFQTGSSYMVIDAGGNIRHFELVSLSKIIS